MFCYAGFVIVGEATYFGIRFMAATAGSSVLADGQTRANPS